MGGAGADAAKKGGNPCKVNWYLVGAGLCIVVTFVIIMILI